MNCSIVCGPVFDAAIALGLLEGLDAWTMYNGCQEDNGRT